MPLARRFEICGWDAIQRNDKQTAGCPFLGQIMSGGERPVRQLPHAEGGDSRRALQIHGPPHSDRTGRRSVSLLKIMDGIRNHLMPDPSTIGMYRSIGRSVKVSMRPLG